MTAQRRDRHVPRHERYVPREPWRLFGVLRARARPRPYRATGNRGIDARDLRWVRAELGRTRAGALHGSAGRPARSLGGRVK
jgi:hypothetical protein